jgi:hypothetical protein
MKTAAKKTTASKSTKPAATATKGKSKISAEQVIAARRMYRANPELTMPEIKAALKLKLSTIMVGRAIRGISHSHIDMCGLPIRPFTVKGPKAKAKKAPAKAAKAAPKKAAPKKAAPAAAQPAAAA